MKEYADLLILVFDATWRAGFSYDDLFDAVCEKQHENAQRKWPPLSAQVADQPTFHTPTNVSITESSP